MTVFRTRPHWYMLVFHYGLGLAVTWQLAEDVLVGQSRVYSGEFFPWRQYVDWNALFGTGFYWGLIGIEVLLLALYFLRINVRTTACLLAVVLFVDGLGSFLNHRFLMSIEMLLISLCPAPDRKQPIGTGKQVYWNLDVLRWQLGIVYVFTVVHKLNGQFLSGQTLHNLFFMTHTYGMKSYPDWLYSLSQNLHICLALAWLTVFVELLIGIGAQHRKLVAWVLPLAMGLHLSIGLMMGYIWIFTLQVFVSLIAFLPDRVIGDGRYRIRYGSIPPLKWVRRILWQGYVTFHADPKLGKRWELELPDGRCVADIDAWIEVLSLSPWTFVLAEMLRAAPVRILCQLLFFDDEPNAAQLETKQLRPEKASARADRRPTE